MAKDNSTGKTKGFYDKGQAMFDRIPGMPEDDAPAPSRLYDLREWLLSQIDGSEETRGDDSLISHFIRQIDALDAQIRSLTQPKTIAEWQAAKAPSSATAATDAEVDEFVRVARTFSDEHYQNSLVAELRRVYYALALQDAPPVEVAEPDRPDWARQLPGAEIFDRDHGYDRTASINAGRYVCTCGGACSHYDAGGKHG